MSRAQILVAVLLFTQPPWSVPAQGGMRETPAAPAADEFWRQRARGFETGRIDPVPVERAIEAWEAALAESPESLEIRFRLIEALYFEGYFVAVDRKEQKRHYGRLIDLTDEALERTAGSEVHPDRVRAHFWAAIGWGLWGMSHGYLEAGARGVAGKIRRHAQRVIELDPGFADAGGLRLLGRLHSATPRIPLFTGWIDRERGIELLREANRISTRDARNPLFLAEALLEHQPGARQEAIGLLREVSARRPDPQRLVEESELIEEARRTLARLGEGP